MEWQTTYDGEMGEVTVVVRFGMTEVAAIREHMNVDPGQFLDPYIESAEADLRVDFMGAEE